MEAQRETLCAPGSGTLLGGGYHGGTFAVAFANDRDGDVVSPVRGTVTAVDTDLGRVVIRTPSGCSVTLEVGGKRQTSASVGLCHIYVEPGDTVRPGQRLFHAELFRIRLHGGDPACVVTVNGRTGTRRRESGERVFAGQTPVVDIF